MAGLSFFARSTALAWHDGDPIDAVAGFVLVLLFADRRGDGLQRASPPGLSASGAWDGRRQAETLLCR